MNIKKKLKKELRQNETPSADRVLPQMTYQKADKVKSDFKQLHSVYRPRRRIGVIVTAAVLAFVFVVGCGAVLPEIIERINSPRFINPLRQTEVPEGWIGIYDLEDLLLVNDPANQEAKFIFMNDIVIPDEAYEAGGIFEGGLEPLGIYRREVLFDQKNDDKPDRSFYGEVNGNGYTIRNLKLVSAAYRIIGNGNYFNIIAGLFAYGSAEIMHLGIEDVVVNVEIGENVKCEEIFVGSLAAKADVVAGCYAKNVEVYFSNASDLNSYGTPKFHEYGHTAVGGLCGYADYVDSCFVKDAVIKTECTGSGAEIMVGGVCGTSLACVTSYFEGEIISNNENYDASYVDDVCAMAYPAYVPIVLSKDSMMSLRERFVQAGIDVNSFDYKKFISYYIRYDLDAEYPDDIKENINQAITKIVRDFYSTEVGNLTGEWYLLDDFATNMEEMNVMTKLLAQAFNNDVSEIENFCAENDIKCGRLHCHSFDIGEEITREALEGFDFENIWEETDEGIIQKIFVD